MIFSKWTNVKIFLKGWKLSQLILNFKVIFRISLKQKIKRLNVSSTVNKVICFDIISKEVKIYLCHIHFWSSSRNQRRNISRWLGSESHQGTFEAVLIIGFVYGIVQPSPRSHRRWFIRLSRYNCGTISSG